MAQVTTTLTLTEFAALRGAGQQPADHRKAELCPALPAGHLVLTHRLSLSGSLHRLARCKRI
jgi:hypothetical protein